MKKAVVVILIAFYKFTSISGLGYRGMIIDFEVNNAIQIEDLWNRQRT